MSQTSDQVAPRSFAGYEIVQTQGQGGMGTVYKAIDSKRRTEFVALKVASRAVANENVLALRFSREYEIARQLKHPNLVEAFEYGVEDGLPYLVMEYVDGLNLDRRVKRQGPLTSDQALVAFEQLCSALSFIHGVQLIHRDIKPSNILITTN